MENNNEISLIRKILNRAKIKEFGERIIGYLNKEDFFYLWNIREKKINEYVKLGLTKTTAKKKAYENLFKIINPLPAPVKVTHFGYAPAYSLIKDKEKIKNKIDKDWAIWVNKMKKNAKALTKNATDEKEKQKILEKFEANIKEAEYYYQLLKRALENGEDIDILYTNFEFVNTIYHPYVYIIYLHKQVKKSNKIYLKQDVMNIIYEDDIVIPKKSKLQIKKRLQKMKNVFGYYYISK